MSGYRFLYRLTAGFWLIVGVFLAMIAFAYLVVTKLINDYLVAQYQWMPDVIGRWLGNVSPGVVPFLGILLGLFCLYFGGGLLLLKPWARTVGMGFHFGMGMVIVALSISIYQLMTNGSVIAGMLGEYTPVFILGVGIVVGVGLLSLGFQMGSRTAIEIFTGETAAQVPTPKAICPTCKGPLDVNKELCPRCDAVGEMLVPPSKPSLIDLTTGKEYLVSTVRSLTFIGRENPDASLQFDDPTVSKDHAVIEYNDGSFFLHARQDTNGTFVNDEKVRDREIVHNDIIRFGRVKVKFIAGD